MAARIIDGKAIADNCRQATADAVTAFRTATGVTPHLAAILVGQDRKSVV